MSILPALRHNRIVRVTLHFFGLDAASPSVETVVKLRAHQVTVANTAVFGGAVNLRVPEVKLRDHLLDIVVHEAVDFTAPRVLAETTGALGRKLAGSLRTLTDGDPRTRPRPTDEILGLALPGVRHYKARAVLIESSPPADIATDGEICFRTPALVRAVPDLVSVLIPPSARAELASHDETLAAPGRT